MTNERRFWAIWIVGLLLFAVTIALSLAVEQPGVTLGIADHQAAGSAARVDQIHAQWAAADVKGIAFAAMIMDLIFIGVFAWGSYLLGRMFAANGRIVVRLLGMMVVVAAFIFGASDYLETVLQLIQLVQDRGSDWMASTAASVRPLKIAAWVVCFGGVLLAAAFRWIRRRLA